MLCFLVFYESYLFNLGNDSFEENLNTFVSLSSLVHHWIVIFQLTNINYLNPLLLLAFITERCWAQVGSKILPKLFLKHHRHINYLKFGDLPSDYSNSQRRTFENNLKPTSVSRGKLKMLFYGYSVKNCQEKNLTCCLHQCYHVHGRETNSTECCFFLWRVA